MLFWNKRLQAVLFAIALVVALDGCSKKNNPAQPGDPNKAVGPSDVKVNTSAPQASNQSSSSSKTELEGMWVSSCQVISAGNTDSIRAMKQTFVFQGNESTSWYSFYDTQDCEGDPIEYSQAYIKQFSLPASGSINFTEADNSVFLDSYQIAGKGIQLTFGDDNGPTDDGGRLDTFNQSIVYTRQ